MRKDLREFIRWLEAVASRPRGSLTGAEVLGDDPDLASYLQIEERELEAGGLNWTLPWAPERALLQDAERTGRRCLEGRVAARVGSSSLLSLPVPPHEPREQDALPKELSSRPLARPQRLAYVAGHPPSTVDGNAEPSEPRT